ncbi:MAG: fumarylacetoacetate hydrolase family protein [Rhodospirillales bacterium]
MSSDSAAATPAAPLSSTLADLATQLWAARRDGGAVDLGAVTLPLILDEGYGVQAAVDGACGAPIAAFKIGSSSKASQEKLGTDEPWFGAVAQTFMAQSGATVPSVAHTLAVEGEFAFRLSADLPARDSAYTEAEVRAAVDRVAGAIEVVGRRFEGGPEGGAMLPLLVADGGVNVALILGTAKPFTPDMDFRDHGVVMRINGAERGRGVGSMALGDPLNSLLWLVNGLSRRGRGLTAGQWVSTGTCTGIEAAAPGDRAQADFGDLGVVEVTLDR